MKISQYWISRWKKRVITISVLAILLLVVIVGNYRIDYYVDTLTRAGGWAIIGTPMDIGLVYEDVSVTTTDGMRISGWYLPGHTSKAVVLVHGIWGNKQQLYLAAIMLVEAGYHVLAVDLRGHGHSEGERLSYGYYEALDVQAGVEYLMRQPDVENVGVIGFSYGGAAAVRAASLDDRIRAIVIESSFSSLPDAIEDSFSRLTGLPSWPFASLIVKKAERKLGIEAERVNSAQELATMSPRPVLIIHGKEDELFPVSHAFKLYEAAQEPKDLWVIEGLTHSFPVDHKAEYRDRVMRFFEEAFAQ